MSVACATTLVRASTVVVAIAGIIGNVTADDVLVGERARHPLTALVGIPNAASRAPGQSLQTRLLHGNAFMGAFDDDERLQIDGATTELAVTWRQALTSCSSLSARLPVIAHGGGVFDSEIEAWHDVFGLPNGGRQNALDDQLLFEHEVDGQLYSLASDTVGVGDVSLWIRQLTRCADPVGSWLWRVGGKLPTGREQRWLGSGGVDIWADVQTPVYQPWPFAQVAASAGLVFPGRSDVLPTLESVALYGAAGIRFTMTHRLSASVTLDWHSALFDSALTELGQLSGQLTTGLRFTASRATRIDVQITEDVLVDTATDIALRIAVTTQFGNGP